MVALTLLLACLLVASDEEGERISGADVQEHVDVLASDLFEGREAGTVGEQRAAAYLVSVLEDMAGLEPGGTDGGWLQEFGIRRKRTSRNVLAVLPGSDEERRHETIVIGAHFDHEGAADLDEAEPLAAGTRRRVFNGADDNASGTAVLLELARVLASSADRPRRTIAFHWYGAEESGLLGSEHYTGHPTRRLSDTVFMLNLDMVGRLRDRTVQVQGTGSSPLLGELARAGCAEVGLALRDEPLVSSNSDQWSFFVHRVPVLHLFTGFHRDYHKPGDEAHKINAEGAAEVGRLALQILRGVDALERIPFSDVGERTERWWPRPDIGASLRHLPRRTLPGRLLVTAIEPGSPAADGGLLPGDVIVRIDGQSVLDEDGLAVHMDVDGSALREHRLEILRRRPDAPEGQGGMEPLESLTLSVRPELR